MDDLIPIAIADELTLHVDTWCEQARLEAQGLGSSAVDAAIEDTKEKLRAAILDYGSECRAEGAREALAERGVSLREVGSAEMLTEACRLLGRLNLGGKLKTEEECDVMGWLASRLRWGMEKDAALPPHDATGSQEVGHG